VHRGGLDLGVLAAVGRGRLAWCADPDPHVAAILAPDGPSPPASSKEHVDT
jgi:DNA (cytosine-5)-methyltransferase 1